MSKNIPVITSNANHFSDLNTIKANTSEEMANELDKLFSNSLLAKQQVERQKLYIEKNSWKIIAKKYVDIFENIGT